MDHREQISHFSDELEKLIQRFRKEYELPYSSVIGCLEIQKHLLIQEAGED